MSSDRPSFLSGTHVTGEQLDRLRDGSLPPAEVAEVGRHAAACESCGKAIAGALPAGRMTRDLRVQIEAGPEPEHLSGDELMACADGTLRDHPHLQECESCRAELDELLRFKSTMRPRTRRGWRPYAVAAALAAAIAAIALTIPLANWTVDRAPRTPAPPPSVSPHVSTGAAPVPPEPVPVPVATGYGRPEWDGWVAGIKTRRALSMPAVIASLRPQKTHLRGAAEEDDLRLSPDQTVVADPRPRFQWSKQQGASYNVILRNGAGIVESGALTDPHWTPPRELKHGREYQWQVEVTVDGVRSIYPKAPDPPARFRLLDESALAEIEEARKQHPEDALLHTVILARHGLRAETLAALDRLEQSDPSLAADLRASLRSWVR